MGSCLSVLSTPPPLSVMRKRRVALNGDEGTVPQVYVIDHVPRPPLRKSFSCPYLPKGKTRPLYQSGASENLNT